MTHTDSAADHPDVPMLAVEPWTGTGPWALHGTDVATRVERVEPAPWWVTEEDPTTTIPTESDKVTVAAGTTADVTNDVQSAARTSVGGPWTQSIVMEALYANGYMTTRQLNEWAKLDRTDEATRKLLKRMQDRGMVIGHDVQVDNRRPLRCWTLTRAATTSLGDCMPFISEIKPLMARHHLIVVEAALRLRAVGIATRSERELQLDVREERDAQGYARQWGRRGEYWARVMPDGCVIRPSPRSDDYRARLLDWHMAWAPAHTPDLTAHLASDED